MDIDPAAGWASWAAVAPTPPKEANALRWSTMYSFSFDADSPPEDALASIGLFKEGGPSSVAVYVQAPATNLIPLFADGFEDGTADAWIIITP